MTETCVETITHQEEWHINKALQLFGYMEKLGLSLLPSVVD